MAYKLGVTNHLLHGMILQVTGVRGFFVGKHSGLGCAYRDELEWAAWMTIFPIKWRANEQQGKGWAPTRGKFFVFLAWFCFFFPQRWRSAKLKIPASHRGFLIDKNIMRVEIVAKLFTYFWVYKCIPSMMVLYMSSSYLNFGFLGIYTTPLERWLIEQPRTKPPYFSHMGFIFPGRLSHERHDSHLQVSDIHGRNPADHLGCIKTGPSWLLLYFFQVYSIQTYFQLRYWWILL